MAIARTEDTVVEAVSRRKTSLNAETVLLVEDFETRAAALTSKAQALLGAGSVLAKLDGGQRVLDRLAPPMTLAARELLARLDRLPNGRTKRKPIREVELALTRMLEVLNQTGDDDEQPADWRAAEFGLERSATTVTGSLMRGRRFGPDVPLVDREDQSSLRTGLGLQADGSERVLKALDEAIATVKMRFGALDFDFEANVSDSPSTVGTPNTKSEADKQGVAGLLETLARSRKAFHRAQPHRQATASGSNPMWGSSTSSPLCRKTLLSWSAVLLIVSFTLSMMILAGKSRLSGATLPDDLAVHSFMVDGDHQGINQFLLETRLSHNFSQQVDVTVAVRSAKDYLGLAHSPSAQDTSQPMSEDTAVLLDAMWRLKQEFPDVVDPAIQELLDGKALIPVWYLDDGTFTIPAYLSSAIDETGHGVFGST